MLKRKRKQNRHYDIEYRLQIIFIVWIGTHNEYDKIDVKTVAYVKTN